MTAAGALAWLLVGLGLVLVVAVGVKVMVGGGSLDARDDGNES